LRPEIADLRSLAPASNHGPFARCNPDPGAFGLIEDSSAKFLSSLWIPNVTISDKRGSEEAIAELSIATVRSGLGARLLRSFGFQSLDVVLRVVQHLIIVPVLIWAWGADLYQDWIVLLAATNFLSILDFGMQTFFVNSMLVAWTRQSLKAYR